MNPTEIKLENVKIRRCALPRNQGKGKIGVLGIHGYTGYTGELYYPAEKLAESGFTVSLPRLPGHGTCGEDFNLSNGSQWLRACIDAYLELKRTHEKVYLMGHSMGGVLALLLASMFPVEKIVLMAPALKLTKPIRLTEPLSLILNKRLNKNLWEQDTSMVFLDDRDEDDDLYLGQEYWTWSYFRRLADLSRLSKRSLKQLPLVQGDILTILGRKDPTVSIKAGDAIKKRSGGKAETVILENSGHLVPYDKDFIKNAELIVSWMR